MLTEKIIKDMIINREILLDIFIKEDNQEGIIWSKGYIEALKDVLGIEGGDI